MQPVVVGSVAATLSGAPSTLLALVRGDDVLASARAAGTLLGKPTLPRAAVAHVAISLGWAVVLDAVLPRRRPVAWGVGAGLGIAALDLGLIGRRFPAVRALPVVPQVLDHVVYGVVVAVGLRGWPWPRPASGRTSPGPPPAESARARWVSPSAGTS